MQKHYKCLGITCADVGGIWVNGEYQWPGCYDAVPPPSPPPSPPAPPPSDDGLSSGQLAGIIVGCVVGGALLTGTPRISEPAYAPRSRADRVHR